jgi:hypothetical protein
MASLKTGDRVMAADGYELGKVSEVGDTCFKVNSPGNKKFWLAKEAIDKRSRGVVSLRVDQDHLAETHVSPDQHSGAHSHDGSGGARIAPLSAFLALGLAGMVALKDRERRDKLTSTTRQAISKVKEMTGAGSQSQPSTSSYSYTSTPSLGNTVPSPPSSSPPPRPETLAVGPNVPVDTGPEGARSNEVMTEVGDNTRTGDRNSVYTPTSRETAIVAIVTQAFPERTMRVAPVEVTRLEGGKRDTLRFTLDEAYSADMERDRIESSAQSPESLAEIIIADLRDRLPPQ